MTAEEGQSSIDHIQVGAESSRRGVKEGQGHQPNGDAGYAASPDRIHEHLR
jgi:hypothetical protein